MRADNSASAAVEAVDQVVVTGKERGLLTDVEHVGNERRARFVVREKKALREVTDRRPASHACI